MVRTASQERGAASSRPNIELVGPAERQSGIQLPQLLVSLLVVALVALLILWWNTSSTAREPVVALANDVVEGQVIEAADLQTVFVSSDTPIQTSPEQFANVFVGAVAGTDLEAGTLVTGSMFQQSELLGPNEALVGVLLGPNEYPPGISTGDSVQILVLSEDSPSTPAVVEQVQVSSNNAWIRLRVDRDDAERIQRAAAANRIAVFEVSE